MCSLVNHDLLMSHVNLWYQAVADLGEGSGGPAPPPLKKNLKMQKEEKPAGQGYSQMCI